MADEGERKGQPVAFHLTLRCPFRTRHFCTDFGPAIPSPFPFCLRHIPHVFVHMLRCATGTQDHFGSEEVPEHSSSKVNHLKSSRKCLGEPICAVRVVRRCAVAIYPLFLRVGLQ